MEDFLVSKDPETGRVFALSPELSAVFEAGSWREGSISADDLKDNFERIRDEREASTLFHEASAALSSNPSLSKAASQAS